MNNPAFPIYDVYKGIKIYVYEDVEDPSIKGVQFDWYGRLIEAETEEWETPTLANKLAAAHAAIDLCFHAIDSWQAKGGQVVNGTLQGTIEEKKE